MSRLEVNIKALFSPLKLDFSLILQDWTPKHSLLLIGEFLKCILFNLFFTYDWFLIMCST